MLIILCKDVKNLGSLNDVVEVSDGYAKNFLIKNGLAKPASASNLNENKMLKLSESFHKQTEIDKAHELKKKLNNITVTLHIKCGESGKAFGSVTTLEISEKLKSMGYIIEKQKIVLKDPIKSVGTFKAEIKIYPEISANIIINVEKA